MTKTNKQPRPDIQLRITDPATARIIREVQAMEGDPTPIKTLTKIVDRYWQQRLGKPTSFPVAQP